MASASLPGAGRQRRRMRVPSKAQEAAACDIGNPLDHAGTGPVDQQHLAHHAGRGTRHKCCERCNGRSVRRLRWRMIDTQHE